MVKCITIVQFDTPPRSRAQAIESATGTAPTYRGLAEHGLIRKDYLNGESGGGGVYLWESHTAAQAWFTPERIEALTERFGVRPKITYYDNYVTVDNVLEETLVAR